LGIDWPAQAALVQREGQHAAPRDVRRYAAAGRFDFGKLGQRTPRLT
jgi:hypothetical protein